VEPQLAVPEPEKQRPGEQRCALHLSRQRGAHALERVPPGKPAAQEVGRCEVAERLRGVAGVRVDLVLPSEQPPVHDRAERGERRHGLGVEHAGEVEDVRRHDDSDDERDRAELGTQIGSSREGLDSAPYPSRHRWVVARPGRTFASL
jgi:hypothetical protein